MGYYVLHKGGKLVGVNHTVDATQLELPGVSIDFYDTDVPNLNRMVWDAEENMLVDSNPVLTKLDFMSRFTQTERLAIQASVDPIIRDAMSLLQMADFVDVTDQRTMMLVGYLAMIGLILNSRVAEILA